MAELKYAPVRHNHKAFLAKAAKRSGFKEAYDALEVEYALAREMLAARARAGSGANIIITHNLKDFTRAASLGVQARTPGQFLKLLKEK